MTQHTTKHDLPEKYSIMFSEWGNKIYTTLSNDKIFPKDCDTQNFVIRNHYPYLYEDQYSLIRSNHPNNLNYTIDIIDVPPKQLKVGYLISNYFYRYKYYLELIAYINNDSATLGDPYEFDAFMLGANHCFDFSIHSHKYCQSKDNKKRHKYSQGQILTTLTTFEDDILKESMSRSVSNPIKIQTSKKCKCIPLLQTQGYIETQVLLFYQQLLRQYAGIFTTCP